MSVPNKSHSKPKTLPGYRCMSTKSMPSTKGGSGQNKKMASGHGTNSGDPSKGMQNASGRLGANSKRFGSGIPSNTSGPRKLS